MEIFCKKCDSIQEVELVDESSGSDIVFCLACGEEFLPQKTSKYDNFKIARVLKVEAIPKQKDLKKILVDIVGDGNEESSIQIVTNAKYIEPNWLVVVALENAIVPAGADLGDGPDVIQVKPCSVGGVKSYGILCDSPMLGWTGGAKGAVSQLPIDDTYQIGDEPPSMRPRS